MWAVGEENPRDNLVTPAPFGEGDSRREERQRQLRDEVKSGGKQPTDIRVIHRRNKPPASRTLKQHRKPRASAVRLRLKRCGNLLTAAMHTKSVLRLVLASILVAGDSLVGRYPMGRIGPGIKTASRSASLGSTVYYSCRHMFYGHPHLLLAGIPLLTDPSP